MKKQNPKKIGYKQYEKLLALAHQKLEVLAGKFQELQTFFISYVEFNGHNIEFNNWMNKRIKEGEAEIQKAREEKERVNEKVGYGFVSKNPKHTPNSKQPMFTGELNINKDKVSIAMWRKINYGKEAFTIQATKVTEE